MKDYDNFDQFMANFKKLSLKDKKESVINELKVLAVSMNKACESLGVENKILLNEELTDINKEDYTEDDYNEALIVWVCSIKDSFCDFMDGLNKITDKM